MKKFGFAIILVVLALGSALFSFTGIAPELTRLARTIFFLCIISFLITFALGTMSFSSKN